MSRERKMVPITSVSGYSLSMVSSIHQSKALDILREINGPDTCPRAKVQCSSWILDRR